MSASTSLNQLTLCGFNDESFLLSQIPLISNYQQQKFQLAFQLHSVKFQKTKCKISPAAMIAKNTIVIAALRLFAAKLPQ